MGKMWCKRVGWIALISIFYAAGAFAQAVSVEGDFFPDILGYQTFKCDFHMHTVFSDGDVWPTLRVREAWSEGLDAIAITDHIESQQKAEYVKGDRNTSYQLAAQTGEQYGITVIPGGEITRSMPPGHLNALFIKDCNPLQTRRWQDAVAEVKKQDGILIWNHPGWERQQPDGIARWYPQHDSLLQMGILVGIEVVNGNDYYPEAHQWCLDKNLAMFGNTDVHSSIYDHPDVDIIKHRPMTLVFARDNSAAALREAIIDRRTCVYWNDFLIGEERFLRAIFDSAIVIKNRKADLIGRNSFRTQVINNSGFTFNLQLESLDPLVEYNRTIRLKPGSKNILSLRSRNSRQTIVEKVKIHYKITNMLVGPGKSLVIPVAFDLNIKAKE
ncbi:histidinol-phosphatase [candidate division KSB1 bacterium]|nr:histidinol-phosphatase [candidate division KSB1 bacterium]